MFEELQSKNFTKSSERPQDQIKEVLKTITRINTKKFMLEYIIIKQL